MENVWYENINRRLSDSITKVQIVFMCFFFAQYDNEIPVKNFLEYARKPYLPLRGTNLSADSETWSDNF